MTPLQKIGSIIRILSNQMSQDNNLDAPNVQSTFEKSAESRFDRSIIEGPLAPVVWKMAWPTMITYMIAGMQEMVDHMMVGNLLGFKANAAIGISIQIFLLVLVFISSLFSGMNVLVARFVGAHDEVKVNHIVYQAFLVAIFIALGVIAPMGYVAAPYLIDFVSSDPSVKVEALPFLRITLVFSFGLLIYIMTSNALRSAGDAKTPMVLGLVMTVLNLVLNIVFIRGVGPIPAFGTAGAAIGTSIATGAIGLYAIFRMWRGGWVVGFRQGMDWRPDWDVIRSLFKFGLPSGFEGIAVSIGGLILLSFIDTLAQSAAAQAAYVVSYSQLFSLITFASIGLMGAASSIAGQNLGAGHYDRVYSAVNTAACFGLAGSAFIGFFFFFFPQQLLAIFGMTEGDAHVIGVQLLQVLSVSGLFVSVAYTYIGGLRGTGDTKGALYISFTSQVIIPVGICFLVRQFGTLEPIHVWLAILAGQITNCGLSILRFLRGKWRHIAVEIPST